MSVCGPCCVSLLLGGGKWCGPDAVSPCPTRLLSAACTCSDLNMDLVHSKSNKIGSSVLPTSHICGAPITLSGSGPPHGTCDTFSTQGSVNATVLRELKLQGAVIPQIIVWPRCVVSAVCLSLHICKEQVSTFRRRGKYHF